MALTTDPHFNIEVISSTPDPEQTAWLAMHQCYSSKPVTNFSAVPDNPGEKVVKHLLLGGRGHYSPLEHNSITVSVNYYPHSVMQQIRTHRVGVSFSVQSTRYTGEQIFDYVEGKADFDRTFYVRAPGRYKGRKGFYEITPDSYQLSVKTMAEMAGRFCEDVSRGIDPEAARLSYFPYGVRQHWFFTCNARSLMHLLDLRHKPDAELEAQDWAERMFTIFKGWCPHVAAWYEQSRLNRGLLAP